MYVIRQVHTVSDTRKTPGTTSGLKAANVSTMTDTITTTTTGWPSTYINLGYKGRDLH